MKRSCEEQGGEVPGGGRRECEGETRSWEEQRGRGGKEGVSGVKWFWEERAGVGGGGAGLDHF